MNHPILIAIPLMMLADYALTIVGAKYARVVHQNHFKSPSYELNPVWRKSVDQVQWFNPRHMAMTALVFLVLVLVDQIADSLYGCFELMLGSLLGAFSSICGRHLTNILLFRYLNRNPSEISGEVQLSMKLLLKISQYNFIGVLPLLIMLASLVPSMYTYGALLGMCSLVMAHSIWAHKAKVSEARSEPVKAEIVSDDET